MLQITQAETNEEFEAAKVLLREYADFLKADLAEFADLPWLMQYYEEFEEETANLPAGYEPPLGLIILAIEDDQTAGMVTLGKLSESKCEMRKLFVRESYRGKGIGRALCTTLIQKAKEIGYTHMRLFTSWKKPLKLYESLEFIQISPYKYLPKELNGVFMEKKLTRGSGET